MTPEHTVVRYKDDAAQVVVTLPCTVTVRALWGTSPEHVDMLTSDERARSSPCGEAAFSSLDARIERL